MHPPPGPIVAAMHAAHTNLADVAGEIFGELMRQAQHFTFVFFQLAGGLSSTALLQKARRQR